MAGAEHAQGALPVHLGQEVGDDHHETVATGGVADRVEAVVERAPGRDLGRVPRDLLEEPPDVVAPSGGREDPRPPVPGEDHPHAAAAAGGEEPDGRDRRLDQTPLHAVAALHVEARREVDDEPGLELTVRDGLPDVGHGGPGGDRPVHRADVVARFVGARFPRFGARPREQPSVVAVEDTVEAARDEQLELGQGRAGGRVDRVVAPALVRGGHRDGGGPAWAGTALICGRGTASSTRRTTVSAETSSASAS